MKNTLLILFAAIASIFITGCTSDEANKKYSPWEMGTMIPVADPNIKDVDNVIVGSSSYKSFLYIFGIYEVNHEYAGFDIFFFLDFTNSYDIDNVKFENDDDSISSMAWSRTERLKKLTLGNLCQRTKADVILSPMYTTEGSDYIVAQNAKCRVKCYGGYLNGFKINGKDYKDVYFPENGKPPVKLYNENDR